MGRSSALPEGSSTFAGSSGLGPGFVTAALSGFILKSRGTSSLVRGTDSVFTVNGMVAG